MSISVEQLFGTSKDHLELSQDGALLHTEVISDFSSMCLAAKADGIDIKVASGFRDFERQCTIWQNKFIGKKPVFKRDGSVVDMNQLDEWQKVQAILLYSALPGCSRHHWGCDLDIYDSAAIDEHYQLQLVPQEYQLGGPFYHLSQWLLDNAHQFNFYRPYLSNSQAIAQELWHISHQPCSNSFMLHFSQNKDKLLTLLKAADIAGINAIEQNLNTILHNYVFLGEEIK